MSLLKNPFNLYQQHCRSVCHKRCLPFHTISTCNGSGISIDTILQENVLSQWKVNVTRAFGDGSDSSSDDSNNDDFIVA